MTYSIGSKGQVVIPKSIRDSLGLTPGTPVDFKTEGDSVRVERVDESKDSLRGRFGQSGMATRLLEDRADEPR